MDSFPPDFAAVAERREYKTAQTLLLPQMRSLLLPLTVRREDRLLVEHGSEKHIISMLGEHGDSEQEAEVHCGFYGLVRKDLSWEHPAAPAYFFLTEGETDTLLSAIPIPNRIAMVQGAFALRYEELLTLYRTQHKLCPYGTEDLTVRMSALDDACSREIRRIIFSE